ncbi:MAG: c-type cytochrome [Gemmataceae bacterium]
MKRTQRFRSRLRIVAGILVLLALMGLSGIDQESNAAPPWRWNDSHTGWGFFGREHRHGPQAVGGTWYNFPGGPVINQPGCGAEGYIDDGANCSNVGGTWMWMRSPEQERTVAAALFNRYCIRCHGVDGRGVWDIPGVPDFTNLRWQTARSDDQIARIIIEGRGAVMPTFRGTLTLEEAWAMARYLRKFPPGATEPKPSLDKSEKEKDDKTPETPAPTKPNPSPGKPEKDNPTTEIPAPTKVK